MQQVLEKAREAARGAGRIYAQRRQKVPTVCQVCGKPIESIIREGQPSRRYCGPACSSKAYYGRKHDEVLARQRERRQRGKVEGQEGGADVDRVY